MPTAVHVERPRIVYSPDVVFDALHPQALALWIGRRAPDKRVSPDKLDNIVAGGIGNGHGIAATLFKEAEEEAGIPAVLVGRAVPVGAVSYCMQSELGIRDDVLYVYDLELPSDFVPTNNDGEIAHFELFHDARRMRAFYAMAAQ